MALTALGSHIYAGGFSLGVRKHFKIHAHLEEWKFGTETVKKNLGIECRVGQANWNAKEFKGKTDLVYSNPPCAGWSQAGGKVINKPEPGHMKYETFELTTCTLRCFDLVKEVQPKIFIWECVTQAWKRGREFVEARAEFCRELGYDSTVVLFDAHMTGLPQNRKRMFFVAHKCGFDPRAPATPGKTVGEILASIKHDDSLVANLAKPEAKMVKYLKPNQPDVLVKIFNRMMKEGKIKEEYRVASTGTRYMLGRPGLLKRRLDPTKPSPTFGGSPDFIHPTEKRFVSVLESKLLCGYPADYEFVGSTSTQYAQVAKAVTPPAGAWIAGECARALKADKPREKRKTLRLVDFIKNTDSHEF